MIPIPKEDVVPERKIGVCFDLYQPFHLHKDGNLLLGLMEAGASVELITTDKPELTGHEPPYPIRRISSGDLVSRSFWEQVPADVIVAYTFLNFRYTPMLQAIAGAGRALMVRADSDGRIGRPVLPRRTFIDPITTPGGLRNLMRRLAWGIAPRPMATRRLRHLTIPDRILIESPGALANVSRFLTRWGRPQLLRKFRLVPMIISDQVVSSPIPPKIPQVVAVGRWEDRVQKNPHTMTSVLGDFLLHRPDYRAVVVGSGEEIVRGELRSLPSSVADRIHVTGPIAPDEVTVHTGPSRTFFMPSSWEGFPLAAGEAVCMGCSVSGTPIESLQLLSGGGRSGTLAQDFGRDAILGALLADAGRWDQGDYDPDVIASMWRPRINRRAVGARVLELAEEMLCERGQERA